jgi:hypothetical protein
VNSIVVIFSGGMCLTDDCRTFISPIFLNLMSNIVERAGKVYVRVGGNTQETASLVQSIPDGSILEKDYGSKSNPVIE